MTLPCEVHIRLLVGTNGAQMKHCLSECHQPVISSEPLPRWLKQSVGPGRAQGPLEWFQYFENWHRTCSWYKCLPEPQKNKKTRTLLPGNSLFVGVELSIFKTAKINESFVGELPGCGCKKTNHGPIGPPALPNPEPSASARNEPDQGSAEKLRFDPRGHAKEHLVLRGVSVEQVLS